LQIKGKPDDLAVGEILIRIEKTNGIILQEFLLEVYKKDVEAAEDVNSIISIEGEDIKEKVKFSPLGQPYPTMKKMKMKN